MASLAGEIAVGHYFKDYDGSVDGEFNYNVPSGKYARLTLKDFYARAGGSGTMDLGQGLFEATSASVGDPDSVDHFLVVGPTNIKISTNINAKVLIALYNTP